MKLRNRAGTLLALVAGVALLVAACDDDQTGDGLGGGGTEGDAAAGVNVEAILDDVQEVRLLLEQAPSAFSPAVIEDTTYSDGQLTVVVTEEVDGLEQAQSLCENLSEAIAATDLHITVQDHAGSVLAECRFSA